MKSAMEVSTPPPPQKDSNEGNLGKSTHSEKKVVKIDTTPTSLLSGHKLTKREKADSDILHLRHSSDVSTKREVSVEVHQCEKESEAAGSSDPQIRITFDRGNNPPTLSSSVKTDSILKLPCKHANESKLKSGVRVERERRAGAGPSIFSDPQIRISSNINDSSISEDEDSANLQSSSNVEKIRIHNEVQKWLRQCKEEGTGARSIDCSEPQIKITLELLPQ